MHPIEQAVKKLLKTNDGHGFDHVERVRRLALLFADKEKADKNVVELAVLLHDVDDYKLFGEENAKNLTNAKEILKDNAIDEDTVQKVLDIISTMGYNKHLEGIRPTTLEGKIVSDADMCDAIGAIGIIRTHAYAISKGNDFFDRSQRPEGEIVSADEYRASKSSHSAQHFFDKLLKIPALLMTNAGKAEGEKRKAIMVNFLEELFQEENATEWTDYLKAFENKTPPRPAN